MLMIRVYPTLDEYCLEVSALLSPQARGEGSPPSQLLERRYFRSQGTPGPRRLGQEVGHVLEHINGYAGLLDDHWDERRQGLYPTVV